MLQYTKTVNLNDVLKLDCHYKELKINLNDKKYDFIKGHLFKNNLLKYKIHRVNAVYFIKNTSDGNFYIGSTNDICTRVSHHKSDLLLKNHRNKLLQESFDKTNNAKFWFDIAIIFVDNREEAYNIEQFLLDFFKNDDNKCNKAINSRISGLGIPMSNKSKMNMSKVQKGIIRSKETRLRLSLGHLQNKDSNYEKLDSVEKYKQLTINGVKYLSIREASEKLRICRKNIKRRLNDPSNNDYIFS